MQTRHSKKIILAGFAFILITLFAAGVGGLSQLNQLNQQQLVISENYQLKHDLVHHMLTASRERAITLNQIANLVDPFERDEQIMHYHSLGADFAAAREELLTLLMVNEELTLLEKQGIEVAQGLTNQHRVIELANDELYEQARELLTHTAIPTQQRIFSLLQRLYTLQTDVYERQQATTAESNSQTYLTLLITLGSLSLIIGVLTAFVVIRQITQSERALYQVNERAQVTLHSIGDAVITTDEFGKITYINPIAEELIGRSSDAVKGKSLEECCRMIDEDHDCPTPNPALGALELGAPYELKCTAQLISDNGDSRSITASAAPIRDSNGIVIGAVMVLRDVTKNREMTRRLSWQASHDALTGLYNRQELEKQLEQMLEEAQRDDVHHILLYLDLDQFKLVNDTSGHLAGDELLRQLGYLLKKTLRETDLLARLGGDEFGILLSHCNIDKAIEIAEKLRILIHEFRFVWQDNSFEIGVSIGIAPIDQRTESITAVMSAADVACYAAKDLGRNRYHIYVPEDKELARRHDEMAWVNRIRQAIDENRLVLYRQAIQSIHTETAHEEHTEILVRMVAEKGELIAPGQFIPAAERYNLMPLVDRKVIELTLSHMAKEKNAPHSVAINLSGNTFGDKDFLSYIQEQLQQHGIEANRLCFEITETAAITKLSSAIHFIQELKQLGCRFALDDFGSGLSSFSYLKNLPVDYLKIDGAFVRDIVDDPYDRAMVEAICRVGRVMELKTIAEFVENDEILEELRRIGIDYVQGYGIEKPRPLVEPTGSNSVKGGS